MQATQRHPGPSGMVQIKQMLSGMFGQNIARPPLGALQIFFGNKPTTLSPTVYSRPCIALLNVAHGVACFALEFSNV